MDGKIYDLLKKIDEVGIIKFGLEKDHRIYLKRLLLDEDFLNENIKNNGGIDLFFEKLNAVYSDLNAAKDDLDKIKKISDNPEFKEIIDQYFGKELENIENARENVIAGFVKKNIENEALKEKEIQIQNDDQNKINEILNKLKNK